MGRRAEYARAIAVGLAAGAVACADAIAPEPPAVRLTLVQGDGQRAFWRDTLPQRIRVVALDAHGSTVAGIVLTAEASGGGAAEPAELRTDAHGAGEFRWRLGTIAHQELLVRTAAAGTERSSATIGAEGVDPADADVFLLGAPGAVGAPITASLVVFDSAGFADSDTDALTLVSDTPVRVLPFRDPTSRTALMAFADGYPPALTQPVSWSARRDSVAIILRAAIEIPVTVWLVVPEPGTAAEAMVTLARTDSIWRHRGVGLRWSDANIVGAAPDISLPAGPVPDCGGAIPGLVGAASNRLNIYIGPAVAGFGAQWCGSHIYASTAVFARPALLAHELGHAFALGHSGDPANLMHPRAADEITDGQAFKAHYHYSSILNAWFNAQPATHLRDCHALVRIERGEAVTRCPQEEWRAARLR